MIVRGQLHAEGNWRGLVVTHAWALDGIFGGYEGQLDNAGGRDRYVTAAWKHGGGEAGRIPQG
jgi:hypothetical protein